MLKKLPLLALLILLAVTTSAQSRILTPDEFLPHKIGSQFTEHSLLVDYYQHVAANSDRVKLVEFGRTNQQRTQILAIVSSPENLRRIEEIRQNNLRSAGILPGTADNANSITIVWLGLSVHGNEAAGSEASMPLLYDLANPRNLETSEWLKNTVVLIEPSVNPDGYSRYTDWYRQASPALPDPNPASREHDEPWPGGRVNQYLFDLNRDWAWSTQVETQNRLKIYNDWLPHVVADIHEQGYTDSYYFPPAAQPYHQYLSKWQADFQVEIGKNHAKYFDRNGWLYFTKEVFDLLYPSYGDTYPCYNGAIGMTYEQGGIGAGRAINIPNGDTLTLYDRVAHHKATALSTVEISSKNAGQLVQNFADFYKRSSSNPPGEYKSFVVKSTNPAAKIKAFTEVLDRLGIRYGKVGKVPTGLSGYDYSTGKADTKFAVGKGDLVVSAYQPKGMFAQILLEPEAAMVDSNTYDITAWSLLHAHGLEAFAVRLRIDPAEQGYDFAKQNNTTAATPYAYLVPWNSMHAARFLAEVVKNGMVCRYAELAFRVDGKDWPAGTLVVTKGDNRKHPDFDRTVQDAANRLNLAVTPVQTGFVETGHDLGSDAMRLISPPKVLVLSGEKTWNNEFGQVWFYFDKDISYPATIVDAGQLSGMELKDFNVLVLPEGSFDFEDATLGKLGDWVTGGGKLIAIGNATTALSEKKGFNLAKFAKTADKDSMLTETDRLALDHRTALFKDRSRSSISDFNPGAVVRVKMDKSHPLALGLKDYYFSLKTSSLRYDLLKDAWNVGYLEEDYLSLGFIGANVKKQLKNSAVFAVQRKGSGQVVYLVDNPLFRSFWEEGKLLFSNAVFLVN